MLRCCVAIMAYNEEATIGKTMKAVLRQELEEAEITEVVVIASGCTDGTEEIIRTFARKDRRVRLVIQPCRSGKSSAVNLLLRQATQEIIVLVNADTVPAPDAIEHLVASFKDSQVGMVGGRPMPVNDDRTFMGYAVHLLWTLHHQLSLHWPKMGEVIAFRSFFHQIPPESAVDEASIEPLIRGQGLRLGYVPEAVVYNRGPDTVHDYLRQRRRIYAGHVYVRDTLGYRVSTMKGVRVLWLLLKSPGVKRDWRYFVWGPAIIGLEVWARLLGMADYRMWRRKHTVWEVAETTKTVTVPSLGSSGSGG